MVPVLSAVPISCSSVCGDAARELLAVELPVSRRDLGDQPLRERVHDRDADAVQAAGHLVAVAAELAAGVELRQHDGHRRHPLLGDDLDRDAAPAVSHRDRVVGVDRHLDRLVVAREGLVDRVVDDLGDEVMEAPRARRADVHAGAQPDRLEAFEHGDVLGRVAGLCLGLRHSQEMPAKPWFCEALRSVSDRGVGTPSGEAQTDRFLHTFTEGLVRDRRGDRPGPFDVLRRDREHRLPRLRIGLRERARREADARHPERSRDLGRPVPELERPDRVGGRDDCTVPSRAIRAGQALRAIAGPTASGQRSTTSAIPACGPKRESALRTASPSRSTFHLYQLRRLERQRAGVRRRDQRLPHARDAGRPGRAGGRGRAPTARRRAAGAAVRAAAPPRRAAARAPRAAARPVSRTGAGRGPRSRRGRRRGEGRARCCRDRCRGAGAPRAPAAVGGSASYPSSASGSPSSAAVSANAGDS